MDDPAVAGVVDPAVLASVTATLHHRHVPHGPAAPRRRRVRECQQSMKANPRPYRLTCPLRTAERAGARFTMPEQEGAGGRAVLLLVVRSEHPPAADVGARS